MFGSNCKLFVATKVYIQITYRFLGFTYFCPLFIENYFMKLSLIFTAVLSLIAFSNTTIAQTALVDLDCSSIEGFPVLTKAPAGVKAVEQYGSVKISNGAKFQVELNSVYDYSVATAKKEIEANDINKLKKYVVDEPNGIIYQSEVMGQIQYHFMFFIIGEEESFYFQNVKGPTYDLESTKVMYNAAKASKIK